MNLNPAPPRPPSKAGAAGEGRGGWGLGLVTWEGRRGRRPDLSSAFWSEHPFPERRSSLDPD